MENETIISKEFNESVTGLTNREIADSFGKIRYNNPSYEDYISRLIKETKKVQEETRKGDEKIIELMKNRRSKHKEKFKKRHGKSTRDKRI